MHPRPHRLLVLTVLTTLCSLGLSHAIDFTWKGVNYRDVKVVSVEDGTATLRSQKTSDEFEVPIKSLPGILASEAKKVVKEQGSGKSRKFDRGGEVIHERNWINGVVTEKDDDGCIVISSPQSAGGRRNDGIGNIPGGAGSAPKASKGGADCYFGTVYIRGMRREENSQFDRVMWRDGSVVKHGQRIPAFSSTKPDVKLPTIRITQEWTNADLKKMEATLVGVKDGKCLFVNPKGKKFTYELGKLIADDQAVIRKAMEENEKEIERVKHEYPWVKFD